jgi:GNAT superfamily N-acetyltransferase
MAVVGARRVAPPLERGVDAVLKDGTTVAIRVLHPEDRAGIREFCDGLSLETLRLRYFVQHHIRADEMDELISSDGIGHIHLAALRGESIVGIADYRRVTVEDAEISFVVSDVFQGRGLGSLFLQSLAAAARDVGIRCFCAETLEENERMLAVFHHSGLPIHVSAPEAGVVTVILDLTARARGRHVDPAAIPGASAFPQAAAEGLARWDEAFVCSTLTLAAGRCSVDRRDSASWRRPDCRWGGNLRDKEEEPR